MQLLAVPGQALYAATRRAALKGADGIVFVANSAIDRWKENLTSFSEMKRHLVDHGIDPSEVPLALQYNKRDLPSVTSESVMDLGLKTRHETAFPAVANSGEGVVETFEAILARTLRDLSRRFRALAVDDRHAPDQIARDAVGGLFGVPPVRVAIPDEAIAADEELILERSSASEDALTIRGAGFGAGRDEPLGLVPEPGRRGGSVRRSLYGAGHQARASDG